MARDLCPHCQHQPHEYGKIHACVQCGRKVCTHANKTFPLCRVCVMEGDWSHTGERLPDADTRVELLDPLGACISCFYDGASFIMMNGQAWAAPVYVWRRRAAKKRRPADL